MLIRFDHQNDPQYDAQKPDEQTDQSEESKANESAHSVQEQDSNPYDREPAKNNNRLSGMELNERSFVYKKKDDSRYPPQKIAEKPGDIFLESFGWRSYGSCNGNRGRRLIGAALWAKSCRTNFLTTRFTKCHEVFLRGARCEGG